MSFGLLIKDAAGNVVVNQDTFTVRLITALQGPGGNYRSALRITCPQAKAGMFAVGVFSGDYYDPTGPLGLTPPPRGQSTNNLLAAPRMPATRVGDGYIELFSPSGNGLYSAGCILYLYADV